MNNRILANAIRFLSIDEVNKANSGHPGAPMGMADIATVLWREFLKHNPKNPNWFNRDRFVLSNGHGSMLLYSLLHLSGYKLSINDIKKFRQLNSLTPGHPECDITPGVETTTGPLGQGLANGVGMALASKNADVVCNHPVNDFIDYYMYLFVGYGCLIELVSNAACSLALIMKLNKLIVFYDMNGISIDGDVNGWFTEDIPSRFKSYGWNVIKNINGHDFVSIRQAIKNAKSQITKPSIICCKTVIGYGYPKYQGTSASHGAQMGKEAKEAVLGYVYPIYLEISFTNKCQMACSYGGPVFSTTWEKEIEEHGPYKLSEDYNLIHTPQIENSPYVAKFWKWFPQAYEHLFVLRVTGGEPLLDKNTYKLLEYVKANPRKGLTFHCNSNLMVTENRVQKYINLVKDVPNTKLYASIDSWGKQAEYIRHGLDIEHFEANLIR